MLYDRDKIIALRLKLGISMNELARRAGIRGPSMHAIERGTVKEIRASTLMGIASALGVRVQDILRVPSSKGKTDLAVEALSTFTELNPSNQQAILAAMLSLAAQQKKKP